MFLTVCNVVYGQRTVEERRKALQEIAERTKAEDLERQARVKKYSQTMGVPIFQTERGQGTIMINDIGEDGRPIYISTTNRGAALTTGATHLFDPSRSGFGLTGAGVQVGVWDGGLVRATHVEFSDNNVLVGDGAGNLNFHANHVTGTIKARGVNERARGMAPEVTVIVFNFDNDDSEIPAEAVPDDTGLILSNHSYGVVAGYDNNGNWQGDPNVSDQEDWRFGFYNGEAALLDEISYNSPYYLMIWAAGNDRSDSGNGPYPPDGPYDIITGTSLAKNIISVGAVRKVETGYDTPDDVVMSSFSSWGPTDDGRIKPDLVGAGVSIFSAFETSDTAYGTLPGTSMAAPNVTGTLALVQELNKSVNGRFLKAATLKALAIHTANEAGDADGPDYSFGWGLMNGEGAGNLILEENGDNKIIEDVVLENGQTHSFEIHPKDGAEVRVTICWTDLPGTPVSAQLDPTDLMLVNDLDLRVSNETDTHMPYILNPANPGQVATKGDNFRDNVEQIEFVASGSEPYTVTINHKGDLEEGMQEFAVIVSYDSNEKQTFYRVGSGNSWDNPENWSLTSGGEPAMQVPGVDDAVVLDNNSFSQMATEQNESESVFVLSQNIEVRRLVTTSVNGTRINLNGHTVTTTEGISASVGQIQFEGEGGIILKDLSTSVNGITGSKETFSQVDVTIDYINGSTALINSEMEFKSLNVENGTLLISDGGDITLANLNVNNESNLSVSNATLLINSSLSLSQGATVEFTNTTIAFEGETTLNGNNDFDDVILSVNNGTLNSLTDITVKDLSLRLGSNILLSEGSTIIVKDNLEALGREEDRITISSSNNSAAIFVESNQLFCFDFLDIDGVDISGTGSFSVGLNGSINNADGWQQKACDDVLFADFEINKVCSGSVMSAESLSNGNIVEWRWYIDDQLVSETEIPTFDFPELTTYEVRMEIMDDLGEVDEFTKETTAVENTLEENEVLVNNGQLVSRQPADTYQWYFDNLSIEGANERTYSPDNGGGTYYVVTGDGECFRKSPDVSFAVTSTEDDRQLETSYNVYPNPAQNILTVAVESLHRGELAFELTDMSGRTLFSKTYTKSQFAFAQDIDTSSLPNGLYVINVIQGGEKETKLVAIEK